MAEEVVEINENDEVTGIKEEQPVVEEPVEEVKEESEKEVKEEPVEEVNPFFAYLQSVFSKEKVESYFSSLNEDQQKFLSAFVSGFQSAIGRTIVGVYDYDYIDGFHFTPELLKTVNIVLRPIEVTDLEIKFVIVAQY